MRRIKGTVKAVDGVSFSIEENKTYGLVGESGCGKTTVGKMAIGLLRPTGGEVLFEGDDLYRIKGSSLRRLRCDFQIVFQDPFNSLNPRMKVQEIISEPIIVHGLAGTTRQRKEKVAQLLDSVGLKAIHMDRYPHEFSGGERQRIGIARALASNPKLIVCDEPVSSLDLSIQAQVLNLLMDLQKKFGLSYLLIAHNLRVVEHVSDIVMVMYLGKIVEKASNIELYSKPLHPYTKALFDAAYGKLDEKKVLKGEIPSPISPPSGCYFRTRCPYAFERCIEEEPQLLEHKPGRFCACHIAGQF